MRGSGPRSADPLLRAGRRGRTGGIAWDPRIGVELQGYIVTALAGGIAQRLAGDPHALDCSASDLRRALAAAGSMAALRDAELHAERVVVRLWPAIERLATTLLRRDRLVGAELERAIDAAMGSMPGARARAAASRRLAERRRELFEQFIAAREAAPFQTAATREPDETLWDHATRAALAE